MYTIVLFASAFVLILFPAFSGTRLQEEKMKLKVISRSSTVSYNINTTNEVLRAQNNEYTKTIDHMEKELMS